MKSKHTAGQWTVTVHPAYPQEKRICGDGEEVCIVRNLTSNSESNSKLIAAAPELLKALKLIQSNLDVLKGMTAGKTNCAEINELISNSNQLAVDVLYKQNNF
jgi:hypothetical protein